MLSLVLSLTLAAAPLQETKPVPKDSVEIMARGCIKGKVFTATGEPEDEGVRRGPDATGRQFRITGARDLMDLVKKHDGQLVQVVAIVRKDALADEGVGMKVGKARAWSSDRTSSGGAAEEHGGLSRGCCAC
jgi:hypothetical protein